MAKPKRPQLKRLVNKWQKKLRLQDWHIAITYAKPDDLTNKGALAENLVSATNREASIKVVDPKYITQDGLESSANIELTVVHEMIHCHIPSHKMTEIQMEQGVEALAKAFMEL